MVSFSYLIFQRRSRPTSRAAAQDWWYTGIQAGQEKHMREMPCRSQPHWLLLLTMMIDSELVPE